MDDFQALTSVIARLERALSQTEAVAAERAERIAKLHAQLEEEAKQREVGDQLSVHATGPVDEGAPAS